MFHHLVRGLVRTVAVPAFVIACTTFVVGWSQSDRTTAPKAWNVPRTPAGHPDLQGVWTDYDPTPFERPNGTEPQGERLVVSTQDWLVQPGPRSARRPSMVIDPPDGRVPLRPEAAEKRDRDLAEPNDSLLRYGPWERCITRGVPGSIFPGAYNNGHQIVQTADHVVIHSEMIHEARVIPTDGRPHLSPILRSWEGDSRGRWEGETLVVDIVHQNGKSWLDQQGRFGTGALHVVERFAFVDEDTMHFQATIDDPNVYTRPWTVAFPLNRDDNYQLFEYACHEGNHALENMLRLGATERLR